MKKQIFFPAFLVAIFLWSGNIQAQVEDVANPLLKYVNRNNGLRFTAGGRLFTDVAYYVLLIELYHKVVMKIVI